MEKITPEYEYAIRSIHIPVYEESADTSSDSEESKCASTSNDTDGKEQQTTTYTSKDQKIITNASKGTSIKKKVILKLRIRESRYAFNKYQALQMARNEDGSIDDIKLKDPFNGDMSYHMMIMFIAEDMFPVGSSNWEHICL